jgi:hypothetical protein
MFTRDSPPPQSRPLQTIKTPRPPPKQKLITTRNPNTNFLYIRSAGLDPPYDTNHIQIYLLRCPTCTRQTFTSLQGLLNHARIGHGLEWGTHEECVRACAVRDSDIDLQAGIEVGLGPNGILPGLRSLFQIAVGSHPLPGPEVEMADGTTTGATLLRESDSGSHLIRTLGLHQDTPALAPFLGKHAIRRGINVWDEDDEVVNIDTFEAELNSAPAPNPRGKWRMPFKHRNDIESSSYNGVDMMNLTVESGRSSPSVVGRNQQEHPVALGHEPQAQNSDFDGRKQSDSSSIILTFGMSLPTTGSRFHFAARIIVSDQSIWVSPGSSTFL